MTTFNDKLKSICNYSEKNKSMGTTAQIMYMDMVVEDDETRREVKRKKRNLMIDTVLDEVDEEGGDYTSETISEEFGSIISPKIMTINAQANPFVDEQSLYDTVIGFLESNTKQKHHYPVSLDYVATNDPHHTLEENNGINFRRIVTKIMHASNFIAAEGRIGPAKAVIVGENNWHWFGEEFVGGNGMLADILIVLDKNISPNKIIVGRGGNVDNSGIICINNTADNSYFLKETPSWERQYVWFTLK
jgi:hypothetical protein